VTPRANCGQHWLIWLAAGGLVGCDWYFARDPIFDLDPPSRVQRMDAYPIERQWRLFLYSQQVMHPPDRQMAMPLAKQGRVAADYILEQLRMTKNENDYHDSLVVFTYMRWEGTFNVCEEPSYLSRIHANALKIRRTGSREVYQEMLGRLCPAPA